MSNKSNLLFLLCAALFTVVSMPSYAAVWNITYPRSEIENDARYEYPLQVLELALQKTGVRYRLIPSVNPMRQSMAIKRLQENLEVNVYWSMTDTQREQDLLPIRIPLARGLIGWRSFIARENSRFLRQNIETIEDLRDFSPVQGISWPDTKILQANGFSVVTARDYIESTELLKQGVADFFPRSVIEIASELENKYSKNFKQKAGIYFYYPTALYFFTNNRNVTLSRLIKTGLNKAIEDGSFDRLFAQYYREEVEKLNADDNRFFFLENPLLPKLTPVDDKTLWFMPNNVDVQ